MAATVATVATAPTMETTKTPTVEVTRTTAAKTPLEEELQKERENSRMLSSQISQLENQLEKMQQQLQELQQQFQQQHQQPAPQREPPQQQPPAPQQRPPSGKQPPTEKAHPQTLEQRLAGFQESILARMASFAADLLGTQPLQQQPKRKLKLSQKQRERQLDLLHLMQELMHLIQQQQQPQQDQQWEQRERQRQPSQLRRQRVAQQQQQQRVENPRPQPTTTATAPEPRPAFTAEGYPALPQASAPVEDLSSWAVVARHRPRTAREAPTASASRPQQQQQQQRPSQRGWSSRLQRDVVRVAPVEGESYASLFARVRGSEAVKLAQRRVHQSSQGHMLVEVQRRADAAECAATIRALVGEAGSTTLLGPKATVIANGLDHEATPELVAAGLSALLPNGEAVDPASVHLRMHPNATQKANVVLPARLAAQLAEKRLLLGMASVRLHVAEPVPREEERCYRCHLRGHRKHQCQGEDRSALCLRCGDTGHRRGQCSADRPKCAVCGGAHSTGSAICGGVAPQ
ncbi:putative mediator of RNA polymerase II transcription subunit 12 [Anopheles bellator]|uniref:putative mediator of RNA polymerase II transcription subunit 12 n=1 Tax=Anopheles bellator TaxID=139047 RepID=UPI0026472288|nr:putative mediator of RNA polymerase II transcription subunit 12 [Anopheles bellator]